MEQLSSRILCPDLTEKSYGSRGKKIESLSEVIFLWDGDKLPFFEIPLSISPDMGRVLQTPEVVRIRAAVIALLTQPTTASPG